jgi:hypothetical protein
VGAACLALAGGWQAWLEGDARIVLYAGLRHALLLQLQLLTPANPLRGVQMCRGTLGGMNMCLRAPLPGSPSRRPSWTSTQWPQVAAAACSSALASSRQARQSAATAATGAAGGSRWGASCSCRWAPEATCGGLCFALSSAAAASQCPLQVGPESAGAHPGPVCYRKDGYLAITGKPPAAALGWAFGLHVAAASF